MSLAFPPPRIAVAIAFFVNGFVLGAWTPQVPVQAARLGLSEAALGLYILILGLGAIVAMPIVGRAIARGGSRRPVMVTQSLLAFTLPALVLAPNAILFAPAIFLYGAMLGGMDVAMNANAVATEKHLGRAIMSSCHGFWSIGGFAGAALGGPLIAGVSPLGEALIAGLFTLIMLWPVKRLMLDDRATADAAETEEGGGFKALFAAARRDRGALLTAVAIGVFALFAMVPEGAAIDWSAIYLRQDLGADIATSGFAFAAFSATMAVFRFAGDAIRNRFGAVATVRVSLVIAIAGLLTIGLAPGIGFALAGFALMGVGLSNIVPVAFSAAGNLKGLKPGVGIAVATSFGYAGILVAPSAIGFSAAHFGFPAVFLSLSGLLLVVLVLSRLMAGADAVKAEAVDAEEPAALRG